MQFISIIMPYYRKIDSVNRTIKSVIGQTYKNFELIIIYDDDALEDYYKIKNFVGNNKKIRIIKNKNNIGAGESRNIGIKFANGEIITFLDSDDFWLPEKLEKQITFMNKNKYDFTFCDYEKKISENKKIKVISNKEKLGYNDLIKSCDIGLSTVAIRKNILIDNLFPPLNTKEDYVAWLKITKKNIFVYNLSENLVIWNKSKNSLSSSFFQKIKDGFKVYYKYEKFGKIRSLYHLLLLSINSLKRKF